MAKLQLLAGTTSKTVKIFVQDSSVTTGAGLTGLVFNTASLTAYYTREGVAGATAITLVTATQGTWTSSGFIVVDGTNMPGLYELGLPNAAIAAGAKSVVVYLKGATNMAPVVLEIELTAVDNQSATSFITGVNALAPPANWNLSSLIIQTGTASAGGNSTITLAGASATNSYYNQCVVQIISGTGAGQAAVISGYVGSTKVATISGTWITNPDATSVFAVLANPLGRIWDEVNTGATHNVSNSAGKQLRTIAPGSSDIIRTGTAQAGGASTITLDAGASAADNAYQFDIISITSGTGAGQSKYITAYVGSTKVATVNSAWVTPPDNTSVFEITPTSVSQVISYAAGQDPGSLVLATPANKLATNASGFVTTTYYLRKNVAATAFPFVMTDSVTHAPKPSLTVTAQRSLDGGAFAACANAVTELANGAYLINLATTDTNANTINLRFTATGADDLFVAIVTQA